MNRGKICSMYLSMAFVFIGSHALSSLQGSEQTEQPSLTQSAIEAMKSYPFSFEDPSLKVHPIYNINDKDSHEESVTISDDSTISISEGQLDQVLNETCPINKAVAVEKAVDDKESSKEEVCGIEASCETNTCASSCCEEESLTGLAAVAVGIGGGGGGGGGGFFSSGGGGGGGSGGGGGGGSGGGGGGGGGNVPIPEPATWLILGGMTSVAAYIKSKKNQKKQ